MKTPSVPALLHLEVLAVLLLMGLALHGAPARAEPVEVTYPPYVSHMLLGQVDLPICVCTVTINGLEVQRIMRSHAEQMARSPGGFAAFAKSVSGVFPKEQRPLVAKSVGARGPGLAKLIVAGSVQVPDAAGLDYRLLGDRLVMPVVKGTPHLYRFKLQFEGEEAEEYGFTPLFAFIEGRWQPLVVQSAQLIEQSQ